MHFLTLLLTILLVGCYSYKIEAPVAATMAPPPPPPPPRASAPMPTSAIKVVPTPTTAMTMEKSSDAKPTGTDYITKSLFKAAMVFAIPETANIKDDIKAQLLIDPSKDVFVLSKDLTVKGKVSGANVRISRIAVAKLTAPDFDVVAVTPTEQILTMTEPTEWLWDLKPKTAGSHDVQLTITAIIKVDGDSSEHSLRTFDKTVTIQITPAQVAKAWFEKYWQWLVSTLLIPLAVYVYKEKFKKKD